MRILVIAAHPDDEVLGCGGTIARLSKEGHEVDIAILGEGATSRYHCRETTDTSEVERLHQNCHRSASVLGVTDVSIFDLPDNRFDHVPLLDVIKNVEEIIQRIQPQAIYTHHGGDLNIDHVITHRAVITAARPMTENFVKDVYAFEIPSSTEWSFQQFGSVFLPNVFMDITHTMESKLKALGAYDTEIRNFPHPRSTEGIEALAKTRGSMVGVRYAEAFELIRSVR